MNIKDIIQYYTVPDDDGVVPAKDVVLVLKESNELKEWFVERIDVAVERYVVNNYTV